MVSRIRAWVVSVTLLLAVAVGCHRGDQPQSSASQADDVIAGLRDRLPVGLATGFDAVPHGFRPRFGTSEGKTGARVVLPARSTDPLHVEDASSGLGVDVALRGAREVLGQASAGYVIYPRGHVSGATVLQRPLPIGAEDFVSFAERPREPAVEYEMTVGSGVKGLRLIANTLEMLDGAGTPRLRVSPPYIVGADGAQTDATLAVDGCAVDLNPVAPWGRAPTPPGAATCTVRVSWNDQGVVYPAVLDPRWTTTTGALNVARQDHTATVLSTGKVLVVGGRNSGISTAGLNSAELYDPVTGTWTSTDNITGGGRWFHTATQLPTSSHSTTSGMVLIAGGLIASATTASAKLYSASTGHWTTATSMSGLGRDGHTATLLSNGKVLLTGGETVSGSTMVLTTAEIYDPSSGSGGWTGVSTNMASARKFHTATLLTSSNSNFNNRVLIVGGTTGTGTTSTNSVELFVTSTGAWSPTTVLPAVRDSQTATALPGGNVLITGGRTNGTPIATALLFTIPSTDTAATWSDAGTMSSARWRHTATLLSGTNVLVSGGASNSAGTTLPGTAELWNGGTTWTATATAMSTAVQLHTASLLSSGAVLVAGGSNASGMAVTSSQLYDPSFGQACTTNSQCVTGFCASGVCCNAACTDQCSACNLAGLVGTCSLKAPGTTCNDGNPCTQTDTCQAGGCTGANPKPENSFCSDGNLCTITDRCHGGLCVPGANVACPGDACHAAGTCDPATGFCANTAPINEGLACDDGNGCTATSQCKHGVCVPEDPVTSCTEAGAHYYAPLTSLGSRQGVSVANDINNHGVVAGTDVHYNFVHEFAASGEGVPFSWTPEGGIHPLPRSPGKTVSSWAISDDGEIVGTAWPMEVASPGAWVYHYDPATEQAQDSQTSGWGMGINGTGQYTGTAVFDAQGYKTFRAQGTTFQQIPIPTDQGFLAVGGRAIDASGNIVGYFQRAAGVLVAMRYTDAHGFEYLGQLLPAGSDWDIDPVLGSDYLYAGYGTNGTQIVGTGFTGNGKGRGFVLTPSPTGAPGSATIKRIDVPTNGHSADNTSTVVVPYRINSAGQVVGTIADSSNGPQRAFVWIDGTGTTDLNDFVDPNSGWVLTSALGINDGVNGDGRPEIVGDGLLNGQKRAFVMRMPDVRPCPPVDSCHAQVLRDPRTQQCPSTPAVANGASCDDGNACTSNDTCQEGACRGGPLDVSCALDPRVEGVTTVNGEQLGVFSYSNAVFQNVNIPYGEQNYLTPPGSDPNSAPVSAPPAWFLPGLHRGAFTSPLTNGTLSWTLGTKTVIADEGTSAHLTTMTGPSSSGTVIVLSDGTNVPFDGVAIDLGATIVDTAVPNAGVGGTLPGTFDVTDDGEATYRIPLWVPEGKAGLQPQLALTYNGRQGNSIVGLGWRIDGLSTISRCHRITGRDGVTQPIQFTDDDRLCLDGERLVLVGGTYNQAGAEYRTEHDQFMKILQTGHDELGPTGFLVYLPNGLMRSYGNDTNTALTGFHGNATAWLQGNRATMTYNSTDFSDPTVAYSTPARLSWALASVADRYTNRIDYNYAPLNPIAPDFKLDFRISSITYNMPDSGGAGGREIDFEYDQNVFTTTLSRSDVRDSFVSGLPLRLGHVLGQITIHGPDPIDAGVLRRYVMSYQNGNPLLLQSVQECDSAQHCKPSTTFDYTPAAFEFERKPTGVSVSPTQGLIPADMDGDGKDDLVYRGLDGRNGRDSVWRYLPSLGTGLGSPITVADVSSDPPALNNPLFNYQQYGARVADMNMDGRADLFVPRVDSSGHSHSQVLIAGASGFTPFNTGTDFEAGNLPPWGGSKPVPLYSADFNGDGLPDLMRATSPTIFGVPAEWSHRLSSASSPGEIAGGYTSFFQLIAGSPVNPVFSDMPVDQDWNAYAFDFDGDGKSELLVRQAGGDASGVLAGTRMTILRLPDGSTSSVVPTSLLVSMPGSGNSSYMMLDVNGDGLPDAVEMPNVGGDVRVAINTGSDFLPPVIVRLTAGPVGQNFDGSSPVDPATRAMDFDQDGRADLFLMNAGGCNPLIPPRSHPVVLRSSVQNGAPTFTSQTLSALPIGWPAFQDSCAGFPNSRTLDVNGDGLSDFVQVEPFAGTNSAPTEVVLYIRSGQKANLLRTATDGLGHRVDVQYKPITDPTVHTRVQCSYPQYCTPHGNTWVVAHHSYDPPADDPTGPPARSYTHTYTGFRSDLTGFGGLGMDQHNQVDDRTTQSVLTTYDHSRDAGSSAGALNPYALLGRIKTRTVTTFIPQTLHANIKTWDYTYNVQSSNGGSRLSVTPKSVTFTEVENSPGDPHAPGSIISQTIRNSQVGTTYNPDFGYLTDRTTTINGETKTEGFTFDADRTDTWLIGQTHRSTIKYDTPARPATQTPPAAAIPAETVTRTTEYHHDPNTGALSDVIVEPDSTDNDIYLASTYVRNPFGQVETTREHKLDGKERTTKATYDPISGVYPYRHTNALGQPLYTVYHPGLGVLVAAVDPNGLTGVRKYDRLGRIREQDTPNGSTAIQTYNLQLGTNGPNGMMVATTIDGSSSTDFYDRNGRPTVHSSSNDNGDPVSSRTFYDPYGRATQRVLPYDVALNPNPDFGSMPSIVFTYDELGRQTTLTAGPSSTAWSYDGKTATHTVTSESGTQSDTSVFDEIGRLVTRVERVGQTATTAAHDVTTRYVYAPFGSIRDVVDTAGNITHADYDVRGRRRALHEPDSGDTIEHHDAFGNLTSRTDGSNRTVSFVPDPLGRVTVETTTEGDSFFAWDTSANGIGSIGRTTSWDGAVIDVSYYNNGQPGAGQVEGEHWEVDGLGFQIDRTYDSFGRPSVLQYPESDVTTHSRYAVQFDYNPNSGALQDVRDLTRGSAALYQVTARFPDGQVHEDITGDEVTTTRDYEPVRRLLTSITSTGSTGDIIQQLGYHYDRRGLMDSRTDLVGDSPGSVTEQFTHDELGRLTRWQGDAGWAVGYTYDDIGNLTQRQATSSSMSDTVIFTPGGGGGGPHALGSLTAGGTTESFSYDPAGRQWQAGNRTVTYTDFDLPRTITSPGINASFEYDANHRRVVKRAGGATTIYVGGLYELRVVLGMATHVMYVPGEQGNVAQVTQAQGGQPQIDFFHGDHLGSIYSDVGPSGMTAMRFDPFGSRISPGSLRSSPTPTDRPLAEITRGFAGLEHDDELGLINMNGRIYDPATARYLTPDPMVSEPGQSQSFNKYSYAQNSPLMRWDPTGFEDGDVEGEPDTEAGGPDNSGIQTVDNGNAVPNLPAGPIPDGCVGACGQQGPTTFEVIPPGADDQGPGGTAPPDWGTASHEGSAEGRNTYPLPNGDRVTGDRVVAEAGSNSTKGGPWNGFPQWNLGLPDVPPPMPCPNCHNTVYAEVRFPSNSNSQGRESGEGSGLRQSSQGSGGGGSPTVPRGVEKPTVSNPKLQNLVNDLYKGAKTNNPIGTGSTADAIRRELATGQQVGGKWHGQKGVEYAKALEKWLGNNSSAAESDRSAAQAILQDLQDALAGR